MTERTASIRPTTTTPTTGHLGSLPVQRVGYGAMQLAGPGVLGPPEDPEAARTVLRRAVELGVAHVAAAQGCRPDLVTDLLREALHPYPDALRIVTKVGAVRGSRGEWLPSAEPDQLVAQVHENLRALGTDALAMVNLRRYELNSPSAPEPPLEDQLAALVELRERGDVIEIGMSNVGAETLRRSVELAGVVSVQNPYSILDRRTEDTLDLARELGLAFVPFFPLGSAVSGGLARLDADPQVAAVAARHGATPAQVALAWLLARSENLLLIPGTGSVDHLEQNLAAGGIALDAEDLAALDTSCEGGRALDLSLIGGEEADEQEG